MSTAAVAVVVSAAVFGVVDVPAAAVVEFFPHLPFLFTRHDLVAQPTVAAAAAAALFPATATPRVYRP